MDEQGEINKIGSFRMLKCAANEVMATIHNDGPNKHRMILFLPADMEQQWLADLSEEQMQPIFKFEMLSSQLEAYPVYTSRGYPDRPDGKHRNKPFEEWEGLPPLGQNSRNSPCFKFCR